MIGKSEELNNYMKAKGVTRAGLNVMCFVGMFVIG